MTTAIQNLVASVSTSASVVANPSINLASLGVPSSLVVSDTTVAANATPIELLGSMETARISWETTELAASNNRLYSILKQAYSFYLVLKQDENKDVRKAQAEGMDLFIAQRGYTFTPSTHDMTRVVKCVFGVDRRRVSAYSIALREALRQEVEANDLIAFIEDNGGVEQIRMGGTKPLSAAKRAERVKDEVVERELGKIKFDATAIAADADWTDKQVVIIATYLPTGEFEANAVLRHDGAVNAALAAYCTQQSAKSRAAAKAERDAAEAILKEEKANIRKAIQETNKFLRENKTPKKRLTKEEKLAKEAQLRKDIAERQAMIDELFEVA